MATVTLKPKDVVQVFGLKFNFKKKQLANLKRRLRDKHKEEPGKPVSQIEQSESDRTPETAA